MQGDACRSLLHRLRDGDVVTLVGDVNSLALLCLTVLCHHLFCQLVDKLLFSLAWLFDRSSLA